MVLLPHEGFTVNREGHLELDGFDLVELAERFGTPVYVASERRLKANFRRLREAFRKAYPGETVIAYAVKANYTLAIIRLLLLEGAWMETFSGPELFMALAAGTPPERIVLTGGSRLEKDFREALEAGVGLIVVDSPLELARLNRAAGSLKVKASILLRVNPAIQVPTHPAIATGVAGSKFGVDLASGAAFQAFKEALNMDWVNPVGVHTHIGSRILKAEPFVEAAQRLADFLVELNRELGFEASYLDLGGGFGIPYHPEEFSCPLNLEELAGKVSQAIVGKLEGAGLRLPTLILEPGRSLVGDVEILLARVGNVKETPQGKIAFLDASTNHLLPVLYTGQYFELWPANKADKPPEETVTFAGPLCFTGDVIAVNRRVPKIEPDDVIVVFSVGAYCKSVYSFHNAQPRPPSLLLSEHGVEIVQRAETLGDLAARDRIPPRLYRGETP